MLRPGEHANKSLDHQLETPLCVLWRKCRDRRLVSDDEVQFGDQIDNEPSVRTQRVQKGLAPTPELGVAFAE
jgi:hypothetical protein